MITNKNILTVNFRLNFLVYQLRNCLKFEIAHKIKKITPALNGVFLIFRAPFRVWGNPKNQNE
jgi:hypothetical protein